MSAISHSFHFQDVLFVEVLDSHCSSIFASEKPELILIVTGKYRINIIE